MCVPKQLHKVTLGNFYAVKWRVFSTVEGYYQYIGEYSILLKNTVSTVRISSQLWKVFSTVEVIESLGDFISTVEDVQYSGECSVQRRQTTSTVKVIKNMLMFSLH